jgi:ABC-type lipoprotein export system ATPase subunit
MIGFVFQSFNLVAFKNAAENVALPLYYQKVSRKKRNTHYLILIKLAWPIGHIIYPAK